MRRNTPLNAAGEKSRLFTAPWFSSSPLRATYCSGSLSTSFYYRGLGLVGSCGVKEYEGPVLSIFPSVPWLPKFPWPVYYQGSLAGAYRPWLAVTDRWSLRLTSMQIQFSLFISASWVLSCKGEAGVIYWTNLHFSGVARAMVMRESQLRWAAVLLLLLWHPPSWLKCHEGHKVLWDVRKAVRSSLQDCHLSVSICDAGVPMVALWALFDLIGWSLGAPIILLCSVAELGSSLTTRGKEIAKWNFPFCFPFSPLL